MRHRYSLTQKVETVSINELANIARLVLFWCQENIGVNRRHKKWHSMALTTTETTPMGLYNPYENKMTIFTNNNPYIRDFVKTIIHEYTHVLQPIKTKYNKSLPREENPFEIEAEDNELKYYRACWKEVRKFFVIN